MGDTIRTEMKSAEFCSLSWNQDHLKKENELGVNQLVTTTIG
jgi:hypothetical protein